MLGAAEEVFPEARYQRCVSFYVSIVFKKGERPFLCLL